MGRRTKSSSSSFWYSRSRSSSAPATPRPEPAEAAEPPIGCMSMVHYLIFAPGAGCVGRPPTAANAIVTPHDCHSLSDGHRRGDDSGSKSGFEAPRNSLDLDADNPNDIQIGVQIEPVFDALASSRTSSMQRRSTKPTAPSSEAETPRTPSLVARLMGIDGLPDQQPSPAQQRQHKKPGSGTGGRRSTTSCTAAAGKENDDSRCCCSLPPPAASKAGGEKKKRVIPESMNRRDREPLRSLSCNVNVGEARSLPDTPRASTSARASWDGPRLSLQALKENVLDRAAQYMSMPSSPVSASSGKKKKKDAACSRRDRDEKAAKEHAREILRQAKETVLASRKNSTSSSPAAEKRQQSCSFNNKEDVAVMMSNSAAPAPAMEDANKLRVVVVQQTAKPTTTVKQSAEHHSPRVALAPRQQHRSPPPPQRAKPSRPPPPPPPLDPPTRARRPDGCERFATRVKKPAAASAPTTSSTSSSTTDCCSPAAPAARARVSSPPLEEDPEYRYLRTVLERGGFMRSSPPPRQPGERGHSLASPVDPIVFHLLELELPADESRLGPLRHRWNRKLLFHLAQELLADLLLGLDDASSSSSLMAAAVSSGGGGATSTTTTGLPLLAKVWRKVRSFPAADCRVVGDIDALVAADLERASVRRLARHPTVQEEAGDVAEEVADRVLDALLAESVSVSLSRAVAAR